MPAHERRVDRGRRNARRTLALIGEELREARVSAGLSQRSVGQAVGRSHTEIGRIERGIVPGVSFETLTVVASVLGLELSLRAFPEGSPLRDRAHLALLARFRAALPPGLRHRTEVPIGLPGDRRAWDEVVEGPGWVIPVEAETRLRDTQALRRRIALKMRDAGVERLLLVVADTRTNRQALRIAADDFTEAFPGTTTEALSALREGLQPTRSAIVLL